MTTASRSLATALPMGALRERLAPPSYTTTRDRTYDWDGFYGVLAWRIQEQGIPATQAELVREMMDWFEARDVEHAPDESTIRKKITAIWRELICI